MTTPRRKSPRRKVERIEKVGGWGNIRYLHHLECGHAESRPRASSAPKLGCAMCYKVGEVDEFVKTFEVLQNVNVASVDEPEIAGQDEIRIEQTYARLAKALGLPKEAITINTAVTQGGLEITSGFVYLSAADIHRIGGK